METTAQPGTAVATRPQAPVASSTSEAAGEVAGVKVLYLQTTYGVGGLHDAGFPDGSIVLDGKYIVANRQNPVTIVPLKATRLWKDYFKAADFAAGMRPRRYLTLAEALATGKRAQTDDPNSGWADDPSGAMRPDGRPVRVGPEITLAYDLRLLLKLGKVTDKDGNEAFVEGLYFVKLGDSYYCPAQCSFEKQAYAPFAQTIGTAIVMAAQAQGVSRDKAVLHRWLYNLRTDIKKAKTPAGRSATVAVVERMQDPVTKKGAVLSDLEVKQLEDLLQPLQEAQPGAGEAADADEANP